MSPEDLAKAYAATINGPANGWGQHVHPTLGRSDSIMRRLYGMVGSDEGARMIGAALGVGCSRAACQGALDNYLDKVVLKLPAPSSPDLVCVETIGGEVPIRLSFAIKVF